MIELYEGRLGGGKTYSATVRMVDHIRRGGIVCTNIELLWPNVKSYVETKFGLVAEDSQFISLKDEEIGLFHRFTPSGTAELPVLVVIDEAHLTFNARDFAKTDKQYRETLIFLTQSRKVNTDIIFIAQSVLNMDKQFMRLVQFIWRFRDLARWKIPGLGIKYPLKQILAVQFDYDGKTILQRSFVRKDTRIFGLYNTDSLVRPFPRLEVAASRKILQKAARNRAKQMKIILPILIVLGIIAGFFLFGKMRHLGDSKGASATPSEVSPRNVNTTKSKGLLDDATKERVEKEKRAYDIYAETFTAWNGPEKSLKTVESGWYQVGEMSEKGFVTAISRDRVKLSQPDGRQGWVVATKDRKIETTPTPAPTPTPNKEIVIAGVSSQLLVTPTPSVTGTPFPLVKTR